MAVKNALLCDDIRREHGNNKHILIGVFSGDMVIPDFPGAVAPCLYVERFMNAPGSYEISLEYRVGKRQWTPVRAKAEVGAPGVAAFAFPQVLVEVTEPSRLEIYLKVGDEKPVRVIDKKIVRASPTASQLPSGQSPLDVPVS